MILSKYIEENGAFEKVEELFSTIKRKVSFKNVFFAVVTLLLANQSFITDLSPFVYVMLGVASLFDVPLLLVIIFSGISSFITGVNGGQIAQVCSFFVLFSLITSLLNIEGVSKKYSVFIKYIISYIIIDTIFSIIRGTILSDLFGNIGNVLIISVLYFVFSAGVYVIINKSKNVIVSKEESVSMIIVIAIAITALSGISIYQYSIANILVMMLILIYGWKNGPIVASAAGLITGLLITCVNDSNLVFVVVLALSGLFSGIFRKFGKIGIIVAFIIGNVYILYYTNNFTDILLRISEMLIASLGILLLPKKVEMSLEGLFNKGQTLDKPYENMLDSALNVKNKIGAISEVFEELSNVKIENTEEDKIETRNVIKKYITNYVSENCIVCRKKHNCTNEENLNMVADYIASKLENNEEITRDMLTYECANSDKIIKDLQEVYASMKLMRLIKKRERENSKKISNQYKEISNILNNITKNIDKKGQDLDKLQSLLRNELKLYGYTIYEDEFKKDGNDIEYTFVTDILSNIEKQKKEIIALSTNILEKNVSIKLILNSSKKEKSKIKIVTTPNYSIKTSIVSGKKDGNDISGDSYLVEELADIKHINILSDGAGSGKQASKGSQTVINLIEKLLSSGFDEESAVNIINSFLKLKGDDEIFSSLDAFILDLKNAKAQFIKLGAAPTYILKDSKVVTISNMSIPLGLINTSDYVPIVCDLNKKSIVVQITDGVINENDDYNNNYITEYLNSLDCTKSVKVISDEINKLVLKEKKNVINDDYTILVSKIEENK